MRTYIADFVVFTAVGALLAAALGCESTPPVVESAHCKATSLAADVVAKDIWKHDFPKLVPAWNGSPEAGLAHCLGVLDELDVKVITKPEGQTSSTAAFTHVAMAPDWKTWGPVRTAAIMCHETLHILGQHRLGWAKWGMVYATTAGRIGAEGTAYAVSDALHELWGVSIKRDERNAKMPKIYYLSVNPECVSEILDRYLDELL